ncbi:MAG: MgtC/SapB family protein [Thermoproteales archaeon]|nr:MgtC/SapB family protein [Thermoproteales archaeon]
MLSIPINIGFNVDWNLLTGMVISFLVGALMGLEREKARISPRTDERSLETPGVRSFGFISLLGYFTTIFPSYFNASQGEIIPHIFPLLIAFLTIVIISLYGYYKILVLKEPGITTLVALVLAYIIGSMVGFGLLLESVAISIFATFMLAIKLSIEKIIKGFTYKELLSALEIGIIVFLVGPFFLTTETTIWIINLKVLYTFFVIILVLSYIGYILVKVLGYSAIDYFAFFGGLVHSEATIVSIGRMVGATKARNLLLRGSLLTSLAMITRNTFILLGLGYATPELLDKGFPFYYIFIAVLPPIIIGSFLVTVLEVGDEAGEIDFRPVAQKPISYSTAFKAIGVFLLILVFTALFTSITGSWGSLLSAILGGLVSSEAVIFSSFSLMVGGIISPRVMLASSLIATAIALLNKGLFLRACSIRGKLLRDVVLYHLIISLPLFVFSAAFLQNII